MMQADQAPISPEQAEAQKIISRLFTVAGILARGQVVPMSSHAAGENRPENHDAINLQYRECAHTSADNE